jgi:hypothetical protein
MIDLLTLLALNSALLFVVGGMCYRRGYKQGNAAGWVDCYFQQLRRERARRDALGRFCKARDAAQNKVEMN